MIRINLAPADELENKLWFVPELAVAVLVASISWFGVQYYLGDLAEEIAAINAERQEIIKNTKRLKPELDRFEQLNRQVEVLNEKIRSLKRITVSKIGRYKPIILLEHLQNIKPEGLWFESLKDDTAKGIVRVRGGAFDNLLVAEFMSALKATQLQGIDKHNIRTQVYFSRIFLERVAVSGSGGAVENAGGGEAQQAFEATQDTQLQEEGGQGGSVNAFPDVAKYPKFELNLRYAERSEAHFTTDMTAN